MEGSEVKEDLSKEDQALGDLAVEDQVLGDLRAMELTLLI